MKDRKEIIRNYKETPPDAGVVRIRCLTTGKEYVVAGANLAGVINSQRFQLQNGAHRCPALQRDWQAYGPDGFVFEVLGTIRSGTAAKDEIPEKVRRMEEEWLSRLDPYEPKGYNRRKTVRVFKRQTENRL